MYYLQVDTLTLILLCCALYSIFVFVMSKLKVGFKATRFLIVPNLLLLFYSSVHLALFYIVYTVITYCFICLIKRAVHFRKILLVLISLLCALPFFYVRATNIIASLPKIITLIGFSYNMLKAIDAVFFVYYTDERIPFLTYANFLLFFPVITAGPIMRYRDFAAGYKSPIPLNSQRLEHSIKRFIRGMFKKMVLVALVGGLFDYLIGLSLHWYTSLSLIILSYLYLFLDLSGYSDIAIATGGVLGFDVEENFKKPFTAASFTQFWRKWHVTLSDWIREHVFVVLNGKRLNKYISAAMSMGIMIVMSLWHEFTTMSLIGGFYMGMFLVIENIFGLSTVNRRKVAKPYFWLRCSLVSLFFAVNALTFMLGWDEFLAVIKGLFTI